MFSDKEKKTIALTKMYFKKTGFWREPKEIQKRIMEEFYRKLMIVWQVGCSLECSFGSNSGYARTGGGQYFAPINTIFLYKASLMTSLHEFKHKLQHSNPEYTRCGHPEEDAQQWSHTIFKLALPYLYERSLREGKFLHSPNNDFPLDMLMERPEREEPHWDSNGRPLPGSREHIGLRPRFRKDR